MSSVKERIIDITNDPLDGDSLGEMMHEPAFEQMIQRGLDDADYGRGISDEEMGERIEQWSKSFGLKKQNAR